MSQLAKCDQGHFFDKAKNTRCPFCGLKTSRWKVSPATGSGHSAGGETLAMSQTRATSSLDPDATRVISGKAPELGLLVGWLVCLFGPLRGQDFRLQVGFNSIGRDESNNVRLLDDASSSPGSYAKIFFDSKNSAFLLMASNANSAIRLNQQTLMQPTALQAFDRLQIGPQEFVFLPLCGERFHWPSTA